MHAAGIGSRRAVEARRDEPRALAGRRFFFDGADHDDAESPASRAADAEPRGAGDERRERAFGIDAAAAEQHVAICAEASMRTGMLPGTVSMWPSSTIVRGGGRIAQLADGVARLVHERAIVAGGRASARRATPMPPLPGATATESPPVREPARWPPRGPSGLQLLDRLGDRLHADVDLLLGDHERRQQAEHGRPGRQARSRRD